MAAPSGTVWGSIVTGSSSGRKGRIGIYTNVSSTNTQTTVNVQVWFWTIYSCSDGYDNTLYYNVGTGVSSATTAVASDIDISHTVATGEGWSTSNQTRLYNKTYTYTRGTSASTYKVYARFTGIDMLSASASMYVNTSYTVPALASYTITYNANGGTGAPGNQTKWYGKNLTLSSTKPTRTGYSFQGWGTSTTDTSVDYAAGATYSANAGDTLYAIWKANTYPVTYNANGGTGAPANQTKTYGVTLKLSTTIPTRDRYNFIGWGTAASATTATYSAGSNYTKNSAISLYAVWELAYSKPRVTNVKAYRVDTSGTYSDTGEFIRVDLEYTVDDTTTEGIKATVTYEYKKITEPTWTTAYTYTSEHLSETVDTPLFDHHIELESSYNVRITVRDDIDSYTVSTIVPGQFFTMDRLGGGHGIAFGKPAELEDTAEFQFDAKFNKPVYGKALGMDRLQSIPNESDLNEYLDPGCFAVQRNDTSETILNIPVQRAGRLEVWSSTGEGIRAEQYSYIRQKYVPYQIDYPTYERDITRGADNVWVYGDWRNSTMCGEYLPTGVNLNYFTRPGVYRVAADGGNYTNFPTDLQPGKAAYFINLSPFGNGVISGQRVCLQIVVDFSGSTRRTRSIWYSTAHPWVAL